MLARMNAQAGLHSQAWQPELSSCSGQMKIEERSSFFLSACTLSLAMPDTAPTGAFISSPKPLSLSPSPGVERFDVNMKALLATDRSLPGLSLRSSGQLVWPNVTACPEPAPGSSHQSPRTRTGNQGTSFLEAGGNFYTCVKDMPLYRFRG